MWRWALLASQATGKSSAFNILKSEDVLSTINGLKKLGVKIFFNKNICLLYGNGLNSYNFKNNLILNANNSGTCVRLLSSLLIKSPKKIKLVGDKSLSKRDMARIIHPLRKFGANFYPKNKNTLPIGLKGTNYLRPIDYLELKGSSQCKSSVMLAAMLAPGETNLKCKPSRNHTELLFKYLKLPIKIKKNKNFDLIKISKVDNIRPTNYNVPSDISSGAFFIALTVLSKKSQLIIKNININPTRIGIIKILKKMGVKILFLKKKNYKGESIADILVKSPKKLKSINCPSKLNSNAIDEFLIIFLIAAKAKGISYFKNLDELNKKESPRLKWASKILRMMGIKVISTKNSIRIFGNPKLEINKKIVIQKYLKDHRVFMTSVIAALSFGGEWHIHDKDAIQSSFPSFLKIVNTFTK